MTATSPLPETIGIVAPGMFVGEIVDHPALAGRAYRIGRALLFERQIAVLTFQAGFKEHSMPRVEQLVREMGRGS